MFMLHRRIWNYFAFTLILALGISACRESTMPQETAIQKRSFEQAPLSSNLTYLVADTDGFGSARIDRSIRNAWGMAMMGNLIWISSNGKGIAAVYDTTGTRVNPGFAIPTASDLFGGGKPTGIVSNRSTDFQLRGGNNTNFIIAGEDGSISAWAGGSSAVYMVSSSSDSAVYTGLAIAQLNGANYLYAADFRNGRIDVYDRNFIQQRGFTFMNFSIPLGFAPFGIQYIAGKLFVTYAM